MGKAAAQALAGEGARVAIAGRGRDRAVATATELSATSEEPVVALTADLTHPGAAETVVREAFEALGGLRGVAITTGLGMRGQRDLLAGPTRTGWPRSTMCSWPRCGRVVPPCRSSSKEVVGPS